MHNNNKWAVLLELEKAMTSNPDLSALEIMEYVLDTYKPFYRRKDTYNDSTYHYMTRMSNYDIVWALRKYNGRL